MDPHDLVATLQRSYTPICPTYQRVQDALADRGETAVNDHVALRTFSDPRLAIDRLAAPLIAAGWQPADDYVFPEKHLKARHYEPPEPNLPKIFISQLQLQELDAAVADDLQALLDQLDGSPADDAFPCPGRLWNPTCEQYQRLADASEYAGWVAAHGLVANHFTVSVGHLRDFEHLAEFNQWLTEQGFNLSQAGGEVKGSAEDGLEQSSTVADPVTVAFADGELEVPGGYVEFARRYVQQGRRFEGFITRSANRIFESTDRPADSSDS
ncbi:MAG: DUF1338 domain-containing protein [Phycisphaeraceae bacterium]|nr:DUF1338 domain-containing protein [Phycisphaeraceae bacterium]